LEWDTVIDVYEPNKVISWHSLPDSVMATSGSINFQGESNNRTRLYVSLSYEPPMAGIGEFFSDVIENPDYMVEKDLINFKKRIEQEFGRTSPQPAIVGYREDKTALNDELKFTL
jgi:uncharacterized membrane protein